MTEPRRLRVMAIHDSRVTAERDLTTEQRFLGTDLLELVRCPQLFAPDDEPDSSQTLSQWADLLRFQYNPWAYDRPDLVLIDCNFNEDTSAPSLNERMPAPSDDVSAPSSAATYYCPPDPRGLFYGAVQVAWLRGAQDWAPFGFAIYTKEKSGWLNDPHAMTAFGILEAMAGYIPEVRVNEQGERQVGSPLQFYQQRFLRRAESDPTLAWPMALQSYRDALLNAFRRGFLYSADSKSFRDCAEALRAFLIRPAVGIDPKLSLSWSSNWGAERVRLSSMLADGFDRTGRWSETRIQKSRCLQWLEEVAAIDVEAAIVKPVRDWFRGVIEQDERRPGDASTLAPLEVTQNVQECRALALTALWAWRKTMGYSATAGELAAMMDLKREQLNRAVRQGLGGMPGGAEFPFRTHTAYIEWLERFDGRDLPPGTWPPPLSASIGRAVGEILSGCAGIKPGSPRSYEVPAPFLLEG